MTKTINNVAFFCFLLLGFFSAAINAQEAKFPIPVFSSGPRTSAAERLSVSMSAVRDHLCQKPVPVTTEWQQTFDDLLVNLIVSEHNLVWVTGAEFSPQENRDLGRFFAEKAKLVAVFERAAKEDDTLKPILDRVRDFPDVTRGASSDRGRAMMTIFGLRNFLVRIQRDSSQTLAAIGELGAFDAAIKGMLKGLGSAQNRLYSRTFVEINQNVPRDAAFRFSIHRVPDSLRNRVDEAIANEVLRGNPTQGLNAAHIVGFDNEHHWARLSEFETQAFDAEHERTFRGNCVKTVSITELRHHIGNDNCSGDRKCPDYVPLEGPIYRAEFVIPDDRVLKAYIAIAEMRGHKEELPPVVVLINQRRAGSITLNGRNITVTIPVEFLYLQGRTNVIEIVAPKDERGDIDDLEFQIVRLRYSTRGKE